MARKGVLTERLLQIVSVTTQVAISRRVSRFKLLLRDRQDARRSQGGGHCKKYQVGATPTVTCVSNVPNVPQVRSLGPPVCLQSSPGSSPGTPHVSQNSPSGSFLMIPSDYQGTVFCFW